MSELELLIQEIEAVDRSFNWKIKGYTQRIDGEEHFVCAICGHCPKLLLERLKNIAKSKSDNLDQTTSTHS